MLKKGDTCYVRMPDGSIAKGTYNCPARSFEGSHFVDVVGYSFALMTTKNTTNKANYDECRFVCMTGLNSEQKQSLGLKVKER